MAGDAVAGLVKRLVRGQLNQFTLKAMTRGAGVMNLRIVGINWIHINQRRIAVTVGAARSLDLDQSGMIDDRMDRVKWVGMAGGAVATRREGLLIGV